jgi:Protein of unknown function (DUF3467)
MNNDLRLEMTSDVAQGKYSNLAMISHTGNEFVFDFALAVPGQPGLVVSRLLTNPQHAKAFLQALAQNVALYEAQYGVIEPREQRQSPTTTQTN